MDRNWSKTTRYLALISIIAGLVWLLFAARMLIGPLVIAALLAYALYPAVTFLTTRAKLGRNLSVALIYLLFLTILITVIILFVPIVVTQAKRLSLELQNVRTYLESDAIASVTILELDLPLDDWLEELDAVSSQIFKADRVFRVLRSATSNLAWVLVILVTAYYLLRGWPSLKEWIISLVPGVYQPDAWRIHEEIKVVWQAYLRGQLLVMLAVGVLTSLISAAIGLPGAVALGLLAGGLDLIPSFGPVAAAAVAAAIAWFEGSTYLPLSNVGFMIVVIGLYSLVQLVENLWLQPRIMGRALRLNTGLVFVAVVAALTLGGALIALVAVPLLGSVSVVGRYVHRRILGLPPWPNTEAEDPLPSSKGDDEQASLEKLM
jgi:predicted PurR-regulated permease PerM